MTDEGIAHLVPMPQLEMLVLPPRISDAATPRLERLKGLESLILVEGTAITAEGRERLEAAFPNAYISEPSFGRWE